MFIAQFCRSIMTGLPSSINAVELGDGVHLPHEYDGGERARGDVGVGVRVKMGPSDGVARRGRPHSTGEK